MPRRSCGHYRGESPRCATCIVYEEAKFLRKQERKPINVSRDYPIPSPSAKLSVAEDSTTNTTPIVVEVPTPNHIPTMDEVSTTNPIHTPLPNNIVMETVDELNLVADHEPSEIDSIVPTVPTVPTSFFAWSEISQPNQSIAAFQYVMFEKTLFTQGLPGGWSMTVEQGYISPTHFIAPADGLYSIGYKVDVRSTNISGLISSVDSATVLTKNGEQIGGSASLVEFPLGNRQYMISNTVMVDLLAGDKIALLFWSNDIGMRVGYPAFLTGALPGTAIVPIEACASIVFILLSAQPSL